MLSGFTLETGFVSRLSFAADMNEWKLTMVVAGDYSQAVDVSLYYPSFDLSTVANTRIIGWHSEEHLR